MASKDQRLVYRRSSDFIFRRIADECVLVPVRGRVAQVETILTLNEVAAHVWERLTGEATVDDLLAGVVAAFDVTEDRARRDLLRFLGELEHAGAAVPVEGPTR